MTDATRVTLMTADGVRLSALYRATASLEIGCVVAHGFTGSAERPHVRVICAQLRERGFGVLAPDLRGHGRSDGACSAGRDEIHDVAAAVAWLRAQGYGKVAVLGWSMGGSAVLRHAGLGGDADAVVAVSSPGLWFERGTRPMRQVHWMFEARTGRLVARTLWRTRIEAGYWPQIPDSPSELAGAIAPRPLLIIHGDRDPYFPGRHVDALADAAPTATVWREQGMGHAETASTPELIDRIAAWLRAALTAAAPPPVCDDESRD